MNKNELIKIRDICIDEFQDASREALRTDISFGDQQAALGRKVAAHDILHKIDAEFIWKDEEIKDRRKELVTKHLLETQG